MTVTDVSQEREVFLIGGTGVVGCGNGVYHLVNSFVNPNLLSTRCINVYKSGDIVFRRDLFSQSETLS